MPVSSVVSSIVPAVSVVMTTALLAASATELSVPSSSSGSTSTVKAEAAGVEPVSRGALKVRVSAAPSTTAWTSTGPAGCGGGTFSTTVNVKSAAEAVMAPALAVTRTVSASTSPRAGSPLKVRVLASKLSHDGSAKSVVPSDATCCAV